MKFEKWTCFIPLTLLAALAISHSVAAQGTAIQTNKPKHHTYKLIDIGTFGGPNSYIVGNGINSSGAVIGVAETPTTDPFPPPCLSPFSNCLESHAMYSTTEFLQTWALYQV